MSIVSSWRTVSVVALAFSAGIIASFILMVFSIAGRAPDAPYGLFSGFAQRLFLALLFGWMIVVGLHLTRAPRAT